MQFDYIDLMAFGILLNMMNNFFLCLIVSRILMWMLWRSLLKKLVCLL